MTILTKVQVLRDSMGVVKLNNYISLDLTQKVSSGFFVAGYLLNTE